MIRCAVRIASITRRAVFAVAASLAIALMIRAVPAQANLTVVDLEAIQKQRIDNENTRHQSVMNEIDSEHTMATKKLADQLKICTTTTCRAAQRADEVRTQSQLDEQEDKENAAHKAKIAQIKADIAAEMKALAALGSSH